MNKIFFLLLLSSSPQCFADTPYIGFDYLSTEIELSSENAKPKATALRAGVSNNNMAFEVQYLVANNTDNIIRSEFDIEKSIGLYFVMQSGIVNGFGLDVSAGYAITEMTVTGPEETYNGTDDYNGFSWAIAMHQQVSYLKNTQVRLAYQSLYKDSDIEITAISLGLTYQF